MNEHVAVTTYPNPKPVLLKLVIENATADEVLQVLGITSVKIDEELTMKFTRTDPVTRHVVKIWAVNTTAAHTATSLGRVDVLEILLRFGANVNYSNSEYGNTLLHTAVTQDRHACVLALVRHRADISIKNVLGQTALDLARTRGNDEIVAIIETEQLARNKCIAFAMGHHLRIGSNSMMKRFDPEVLRMVLEQV